MAKIIIDELVTLISLKLSKDAAKTLKSFNEGLKSIRNIALIATGALTGMAYAMDKIVGGVDKQARFANGIGISYENLQKLQYAASKARISTDELDSALETIVQTMSSTKPGEYNGALLQLGISARELNGELKDPVKLLLEIGDALNKLSAIRRQQFGGSRLGFGSQFTNFLSQGSSQIKKDMEEAEAVGAVLPERLKDLASGYFDTAMVRLKATLAGLAAVISVSLVPAVIQLLDKLDKWLVKNKELLGIRIGEVLKGVGQGISDFGKIVFKAAGATAALGNALLGTNSNLSTTDSVAGSVTTILTGLTAAFVAAHAPAILLGIAIAKIAPQASDLLSIFSSLKTIMELLFPSVFDKATGSINRVADALARFKDIFKQITPFGDGGPIGKYAEDLKGLVGDLTDPYVPNNGSDKISSSSVSVFRKVDKPLLDTPFNPAQVANAAGVTNNVTINVNGAGNPNVVANVVKRQIDLSTTAQVATGGGFNRPKVT